MPGPPLCERPLLARPRRRQVAPRLPSLDRLPLPGRAAQKIDGGRVLHELVGLGPPSETRGILGAGRSDARDAGAKGRNVSRSTTTSTPWQRAPACLSQVGTKLTGRNRAPGSRSAASD